MGVGADVKKGDVQYQNKIRVEKTHVARHIKKTEQVRSETERCG